MTRLSTPRGILLILTALTALGPLATDLYLPAMPLIAIELSASPGLVQLTISIPHSPSKPLISLSCA